MLQFEPINHLKQCRHGQMLFNVNDMYIGRSLDLYGEFSEGEIDLFRQMVQPGQIVLEVGANIGAHTLFLAQQVGPAGRVLAFEPQRVMFQMLCGNMALNHLTNVFCMQQAVGAKLGVIVVPSLDYRRESNFGGLALGSYQQGERVPVVTIDSLAMTRCHLIKVDVEGMEQDVLEGAVDTLARLKPLLYVENDRQEKSDALVRFLDAQNYAMFWHRPPLFNPRNFANNPHNIFGQIISQNMLCVHKSIPHTMQGFDAVPVP